MKIKYIEKTRNRPTHRHHTSLGITTGIEIFTEKENYTESKRDFGDEKPAIDGYIGFGTNFKAVD